MADRQRTRVGAGRGRRLRVLLLVGVVLVALVTLYATVPPPTVLSVRVADGDTGLPLAGARVTARVRGEEPLPAVTTGEDGVARFESLDAGTGYQVQVQKVDYDRLTIDGVAVLDEQETELPVSLVHDPGRRIFVGVEGARVVELDAASLAHIQTIVLPVAPGAPVRHLRLHPTQDLLYVVAGAKGLTLSALTGATLATFDVQASALDSLEVSADGRFVLVTGVAEFDPTGITEQRHLWFLNAESGTQVSDTILSRAESRIEVAWQPDGVDTYVLLGTSSVIDRVTASNATFGRLGNLAFRAGGYPNRVNLSPGGEYLYTWAAMSYSFEQGGYRDLLVMVSTEDGTAVYQEVSPGVVALATSPVEESLFVLNQDLGTLTIIDLATDGHQSLIPVGKQPVALTVSGDGARVYVADRGGPALVVVDVMAARVVESIPLSAVPLSLVVR